MRGELQDGFSQLRLVIKGAAAHAGLGTWEVRSQGGRPVRFSSTEARTVENALTDWGSDDAERR